MTSVKQAIQKLVSRRCYEKNKAKILDRCKINYRKNLEENRRKRREYRLSHSEELSRLAKDYYIKNRGKILEQTKKWAQSNHDARLEIGRRHDKKPERIAFKKQWWSDNKEKSRAYGKRWRAANPEKVREAACRRRSRIRSCAIDGSAKVVYALLKRKKSVVCYYCRKGFLAKRPKSITYSRYPCLSDWFRSTNLCIACRKCNKDKGAMLPGWVIVNGQTLFNL